MSRTIRQAKPPVKGYLVDRHGAIHETHDFYDKNPKRSIAHLNATVLVTTEGKYCYTLDPSDLSGFDAVPEKRGSEK